MAESEKARAWVDRVEAFESSGLSRRAWCRQQGLKPNTLDYWRKRLRTRDAAVDSVLPEVVPIVVATECGDRATAPSTSGVVSIDLPQGVCVRADVCMDATWLATLVRGIAGC